MHGELNRRRLLLGGAAVAGALALETMAPAVPAAPARRLADPFTLGVASGDPSPDGVVLWTRLAPEPLAGDGRGGMPSRAVPVEWQLAGDERFRDIVASGTATADPAWAHSVHVEPRGLRPGHEYFYRFRTGGHLSPVGRTRTAPAPNAMGAGLTMCFASCSNYGPGYFTAYRRIAEDEPGLILHLGDYQYEYPASPGDVRTVVGPETVALADYRLKHAQYKTDRDLQAAHLVAPWLAVFDDHEVENNWADETPEAGSQTPQGPAFRARRAAAFRAYYENMPLRANARPVGEDMRLYRRVQWGSLATFHMLDTRQYRDDQPCGDTYNSNCAERTSPTRTLTGPAQERWLRAGLRGSHARWDLLGQQVFFSKMDLTAGPGEGYNPDAWDGYVAERDRVAAELGGVRNGVVLTGDVHQQWAANIRHPFATQGTAVGTELVATSITSGGDGDGASNTAVLADNDHIVYNRNRRGYVRTRISPDTMRAEFRTLPYVSARGALAATDAAFTIVDRDPTLHAG